MSDIDWDEQLRPYPPFLPEGWFKLMPYSIRRVTLSGCVDVVAVCVDLDQPREYGILRILPWSHAQVWIDKDGQQHRSDPGMKLLNPPTFPKFEDAIKVAEEFLGLSQQESGNEPPKRQYRWVP